MHMVATFMKNSKVHFQRNPNQHLNLIEEVNESLEESTQVCHSECWSLVSIKIGNAGGYEVELIENASSRIEVRTMSS